MEQRLGCSLTASSARPTPTICPRRMSSGAGWRPMATSISPNTAGWYSVRDEAFYGEEETHPSADGTASGRAGHAGRMGRGGELFLPPLGLSGQAPEALRGGAGLHLAGDAPERDRQLRQRRAGGSLDQPHHLRLGAAGARRPEACDVCLGRRAQQLRHRLRLSRRERIRAGTTGRPMSTSSARTSCASTRSTGRPS